MQFLPYGIRFCPERVLILEIKLWQAFRHDHDRGIMIHIFAKSKRWNLGCNQQDLSDIREQHPVRYFILNELLMFVKVYLLNF